jgi:hypothetical protein
MGQRLIKVHQVIILSPHKLCRPGGFNTQMFIPNQQLADTYNTREYVVRSVVGLYKSGQKLLMRKNTLI